MNVFADLLTFLGQDKFQHFLDETPFGFFYNSHHIKIQCQLLRHLFIMGNENVRDDFDIMENQRMMKAQSVKVKLQEQLLARRVDLELIKNKLWTPPIIVLQNSVSGSRNLHGTMYIYLNDLFFFS